MIGPLEDPADYQAFEQAVTTAYDAETAVERELVLRLASLLWRLRRATSVETGLLQIQREASTAPDPVCQCYPEKCARLSKSSSPGAIRVDASLRAAFFVWPTSITEFSNGLAATRRRSGASSGKPFSRCNPLFRLGRLRAKSGFVLQLTARCSQGAIHRRIARASYRSSLRSLVTSC